MARDSKTDPVCWVISDGTMGMWAQSVALAQAMGIDFMDVRLFASPIYRLFPQMGAVPFMPISPRRSDRKLGPPWPDLVINCGKRTTGAALAIKRLSGGKTKIVQIQDPRINPSYFDVMVVPHHDPLSQQGHAHVIASRGSLNRLTAKEIKSAAKGVRRTLRKTAQPVTAVLIGGSNRRYKVGAEELSQLGQQLRAHAASKNQFLFLVTSRRTPKKGIEALSQALAGWPHQIWQGEGDNPYPGILGVADEVIVTSDSVNMVCEACSTGLPVYVAMMKPETGRIAAFHEDMRAQGHTVMLGDSFADAPVILDQTKAIAQKVRDRLGL